MFYHFFVFLGFWSVFGQSWAQVPAQRPRLEKCYINQRKLTREIDSKALWARIKIHICYYLLGSKTPSKAPPRGPESTPRARKRCPRTKQIKMSRNVRHGVVSACGFEISDSLHITVAENRYGAALALHPWLSTGC